MIVTYSDQRCNLGQFKLFCLREVPAVGFPEFYEFGFEAKKGVVTSKPIQYRIVLPEDHPKYASMLASNQALDRTKYVNEYVKELTRVSKAGAVGPWVQPTFYASTSAQLELDHDVIIAEMQDVVANHKVINDMRSSHTGQCTVVEKDGGSLITVTDIGGVVKGRVLFPIPLNEISVYPAVSVSEPLFSFTPSAAAASRSWVADKIARSSFSEDGRYNVDYFKRIPQDSYFEVDVRSLSKYSSMPLRWRSRNAEFQVRSPHRMEALKALGVDSAAAVQAVAA